MSSSLIVDYRALRWNDPGPTGLFSVDIDATQYLTDQYVLLPTALIGGLPVGYDALLTPAKSQVEDGFALWLSARVRPEPSDRVFERCRIDPVEEAGFKVRALDGVRDAHGICDGNLELVGLITPLRRRHEATAAAGTTRVAGA